MTDCLKLWLDWFLEGSVSGVLVMSTRLAQTGNCGCLVIPELIYFFSGEQKDAKEILLVA